LRNTVLWRSFASGIVRKRALNQNKITNVIPYKTAGNFPYSQNFGAPQNRGPVEFVSSPQHELNEDSSTTVRMWIWRLKHFKLLRRTN